MGYGEQSARPISRVVVRAAGAAVDHAAAQPLRILDNMVRGRAIDADNEADTARVPVNKILVTNFLRPSINPIL